MAIKKKHMAVLENINRTIPKELTDKLIITQKVSPTIEKSVADFLAGKKVAKDLAEKYKGHEEELQHMLDAGMFSKTEQVTDPLVEKQIDEYLEKEIKRAIKLGLLPKREKQLKDKAKKNARSNTREN